MSERYLPRRTAEGRVFEIVPHGYDGVRPIWELYRCPEGASDGVMLFVRSGTCIEEVAEALEQMVRHRAGKSDHRGGA